LAIVPVDQARVDVRGNMGLASNRLAGLDGPAQRARHHTAELAQGQGTAQAGGLLAAYRVERHVEVATESAGRVELSPTMAYQVNKRSIGALRIAIS
jgi:hypothetical protein